MYERIREQKPFRRGLRRAGIHFVRAAYEVAVGMGAILEEVVAVVREEPHEEDRPEGPTHIEVE